MKCLELEIKNENPIRIADNNTSQHGQIDSLHYIPGSTIRGWVIHQLCKDEPTFSAIKKVLFSEHIHFLNGYLTINNLHLLPSWKGFYEDKTVHEGRKEIENVLVSDITPGMKRAALGRYCYPKDGCLYYTDAVLGEELSINRGREQEEKNVFRSQYIQKNQTFTAYITFDETVEKELIEKIKQVFSGTICIGNDRSYGLGLCSCEKAEIKEALPYQELRKNESRSDFYLVLLSHMVMRNDYGEFVGLDLNALAKQLGCSGLTIQRCAASTTEVFGYNRNWKGAIPSAVMYEAGSVFHIETENGEKIAAECFRRLEESGIGIRRNEGFGQILFFHPYDSITCKQKIGKEFLKTESEYLKGIPWKSKTKDLQIAAKGLLNLRIEQAMQKYITEHVSDLSEISKSKRGILLSLCVESQYTPKEAKEQLMEYIQHAVEKESRLKVQNGINQNERSHLYQYVNSILNTDLTKLLSITLAEGKLLGIKIDDILTEEEKIQYQLNLMIRQIRYNNREEKDYANQ